WFWWRINAWSEISAMLASLVVSIVLQSVLGMDTNEAHGFAMVMLITVGISTVTWLTVTFLTAPETDETLIKFYRKTRPGGSMWKPIAAKAPDVKADTGLGHDLLDWLAGIIMIYAALFGFGKFLLGETLIGLGLLLVAVLGFAFIMWDLNARNWEALK
ncbi:MAG: sodium:proline symporter, partial [Calditrichaeota bacterium]|nr:sodium:proline symporter [Calditrichota bacterium]